jgi:hypothetical protein
MRLWKKVGKDDEKNTLVKRDLEGQENSSRG